MKKFLILIVLIGLPAFAYAENSQNEIAGKVENYLNSLTTLSADFIQTDSNGNVSGGKFLLKRPGKFRWEYDERQPLEIVSDGKELVYYDKRLKEVTHASLENSLAGFLARKNISFNDDVKLISANDENGLLRVKLTQKDKPEQGILTLFFSDKDTKITMIEIEDQNGGITKIIFSDEKFGQEIADKNFVFIDPKYSRNVWEKN